MGWGTWAGLGDAFKEMGNTFGPDRLKAQYTREQAERAQAEEARLLDEHIFNKGRRPNIIRMDDLGIKKAEADIVRQGQQNAIGAAAVEDIDDLRRERKAAFDADMLVKQNQARKDSIDAEWAPRLNQAQIDHYRTLATQARSGQELDSIRAKIAAFELEEKKQLNTPEAKAWAMIKPARDYAIKALDDASGYVKQMGSLMDQEAVAPFIQEAAGRSTQLAEQAYEEYADYHKQFGGTDPNALVRARVKLGLPPLGEKKPLGGGVLTPEESLKEIYGDLLK